MPLFYAMHSDSQESGFVLVNLKQFFAGFGDATDGRTVPNGVGPVTVTFPRCFPITCPVK